MNVGDLVRYKKGIGPNRYRAAVGIILEDFNWGSLSVQWFESPTSKPRIDFEEMHELEVIND